MSILIVDCESTGLPSDKDARVVEVAGIVLHPHRDYAEINSWSSLVYPGDGLLTEKAARALEDITGIQDAQVRFAPEAHQVRENLARFCRDHQVTEVFSYNRVFDETMLKRSGFVLPWTGCVMRMARDAMPKRAKDPSLADAAKFFGAELTDAHRALPDARAAAQIFAAIRRKAGK